MKRLIISPALFILIAVASVFLFAGAAHAGTANAGFDHDGGAENINLGPAIAPVGGTVTVSVVVEIPPESLGAWRLDVKYDSRVFTAGPSLSDCTGYLGTVCNAAFAPQTVRLSGAAVPGLTGTARLADITFTAVGAAGQCSVLFFDPATYILTDDSGPPGPFPIDLAATQGKICIDGTVGVVGFDHDSAPLDINSGPATVPASGGTTTVQLVAETPPPALGAWAINIKYDSTVVQPVACSSHPTGPGSSVCNAAFGPETVRVVGADVTGSPTGTFNLADITFESVGPINACSPLIIEVGLFADNTTPDPIHYLPEVIDGELCTGPASADIDGDGDVDLRDVRSVLLGVIFGPYDPDLDLNVDQALNLQDVLIALEQWFDSIFG